MELKDFNELCSRDFDNGAIRDAIRQVFKERDKLRDEAAKERVCSCSVVKRIAVGRYCPDCGGRYF